MGGRLAISGLSELHETGTDSSGTLHQAAEEAVARERARMARELHDGLATELAGAISLFKVYLEADAHFPLTSKDTGTGSHISAFNYQAFYVGGGLDFRF